MKYLISTCNVLCVFYLSVSVSLGSNYTNLILCATNTIKFLKILTEESKEGMKNYLLENILELLRQCDWLSFVTGLIERTEGHVREHMVEQVGCEDPATACDKQRSPVLLNKHRVFEEA